MAERVVCLHWGHLVCSLYYPRLAAFAGVSKPRRAYRRVLVQSCTLNVHSLTARQHTVLVPMNKAKEIDNLNLRDRQPKAYR